YPPRPTRRRTFYCREREDLPARRPGRTQHCASPFRSRDRIRRTRPGDHSEFAPGICPGAFVESERAFQPDLFRDRESAIVAANDDYVARANPRLAARPGLDRVQSIEEPGGRSNSNRLPRTKESG